MKIDIGYHRGIIFRRTIASFDQLGLINDPHVNFKKFWDGLNDYNQPKNISYTIVK